VRFGCVVEYDGAAFAGWQRQPARRSVQAVLEEAAASVLGADVRFVGAGRTDAGVHALGQVAHFDAAWSRGAEELRRAMNAGLDRDVAVVSLVPAPAGFHARNSARARVYRYHVLCQPTRSPLFRRTTYHVAADLDLDAMVSAGDRLVGRHDFGAFGRPMWADGSSVRRLDRLVVWREGPRILFEFEADAFLRHQVRRMVGLLLDVGRGRWLPAVVDAILAREPLAPVPRRVPAQGLVLVAVRYPPAMELAAGPCAVPRREGEPG